MIKNLFLLAVLILYYCLNVAFSQELIWSKLGTNSMGYNRVSLSSNGDMVCISTSCNSFGIYNIDNNQIVGIYNGEQIDQADDFLLDAFFIPNSNNILVIKEQGKSYIFDYSKKEILKKIQGLGQFTFISKSGNYAAAKYIFEPKFQIVNLNTGELVFFDSVHVENNNHGNQISLIDFSIDDSLVVVTCPQDISGRATVFNLNTKKQVWKDSLNDVVLGARFTNDNLYLVLYGLDSIYIFNIENFQLEKEFSNQGYSYTDPSIIILPFDNIIAVNTRTRIVFRNFNDGKIEKTIIPSRYLQPYGGQYSPELWNFVVSEGTNNVILNLRESIEVYSFDSSNFKNILTSSYIMTVGGNVGIIGNEYVYNGGDSPTYLWKIENGDFANEFDVGGKIGYYCKKNNSSGFLFLRNNGINEFIITQNVINKLSDLPDEIINKEFNLLVNSNTGRYLGMSSDSNFYLYDLINKEIIYHINEQNYYFDISFSTNDDYCLITKNKLYTIFDINLKKEIVIDEGFIRDNKFVSDSVILGIIDSSYNDYIATKNPFDSEQKIINKYYYPIRQTHTEIKSYSFNARSNLLATASNDNVLRFYNLHTTDLINEIFIDFDYYEDIVFSDNGQYLVGRTQCGTLMLWDTKLLGVIDINNNNNNYLSTRPNPFSSSLIIEFLNKIASNVNIEIYDILGNKIYYKNLGLLDSGTQKTTLDLKENYSPGCYLLVIRSGSDIQSMKVVKSE